MTALYIAEHDANGVLCVAQLHSRVMTIEGAAKLAEEFPHGIYFVVEPEPEAQPRSGVSFSREQVEAWVGFELTDEQVIALGDTLPNSSLPDCFNAVATEGLGFTDPDDLLDS